MIQGSGALPLLGFLCTLYALHTRYTSPVTFLYSHIYMAYGLCLFDSHSETQKYVQPTAWVHGVVPFRGSMPVRLCS